jgi:hypothetical protein
LWNLGQHDKKNNVEITVVNKIYKMSVGMHL